MNRHKLEEAAAKFFMLASVFAIAGVFLTIIVTIAVKGGGALSLEMITSQSGGGFYMGQGGGILNAIVGSLAIGIGSSALALLISLPVAVYINFYAGKNGKIANAVRTALDILWGIPSIVYGAAGFLIMTLAGIKISLLAGIITVTLLILPVMARIIDEALSSLPAQLIEASYALGSTRLETTLKIALRKCLPGIITAVLISFGRGIGDAASVMFTAGYSDYVPDSLLAPAATLPLAIFYQLGTPNATVQACAYGAALVLVIIVLSLSILVRFINRKWAH